MEVETGQGSQKGIIYLHPKPYLPGDVARSGQCGYGGQEGRPCHMSISINANLTCLFRLF